MSEFTTKSGSPIPMGANILFKGTQFSIFSRNAEFVTLLLFDTVEQNSPYKEVFFDPIDNKTGDIWHIWIEGIKKGQLYGYKIDGPYDPENGHRFNKNKLIVDPYSRAVNSNFRWDLLKSKGYVPGDPQKDLSFSGIDSTDFTPKSIVIDNNYVNDDKPLNLPSEDLIIYELHVKGFTVHESSGVAESSRGKYKGIIEKIPYLKELGITSVELLPIQEFDEDDNINHNPFTGDRLRNYWGYSTFLFFAPKGTYATEGGIGHQVQEFRDMVKALHDAGIEVILDVVFNHTAEGDENGPTISFRGIDNSVYYILENDKRFYKNYSGCGNTFNCNHPFVRDFILDCLRYWVVEMNIDGFRFDLASILGRDVDGSILSNPPLIERIEEDPILRNTKIIAEAWDAAGAYQIGEFPGRWAEWNGKYRDDIRNFWRGESNTVGTFATRVTGSSDIYHSSEKGPLHSINFVTCHDGFTLNDLVSYSKKHNLANGEDNRDGENNNLSLNFGIEGNDVTPYIIKMRDRQIKNYMATLLLSKGIPMILAGDEFKRTQNGNNNSYCQDNEISWFDWTLLEKNKEIFRFTKEMIRLRKELNIIARNTFFTGTITGDNEYPDISWHGDDIGEPDWGKDSHSIALLINGDYSKDGKGNSDSDIFIIFNASMINSYFELPESPSGNRWKLAVDTSNESPEDIYSTGDEPFYDDDKYHVKKLSTIIFVTD
jgi:isoamylase